MIKEEPERNFTEKQENNPLHGVKLADILAFLEDEYGWKELGRRIKIRCFTHDPSINSSLKFLRKTPWAREKVERLYLKSLKQYNEAAKVRQRIAKENKKGTDYN
jgi:uncharacterized protein (DUF2132 family)